MRFTELTNEQRCKLIDVAQVFATWRDAAHKAVPGSLRWVTRKGAEHLYRKIRKSERSLRRRSAATEAIIAEHARQRSRLKQSGSRLKAMARLNGAEQVVITKKGGDKRALSSVLQNVFDDWIMLLGLPLPPISQY
jgi:hypothetical protein